LVLKEGGKLKKNEKWSTEEQQLELVNEIRSKTGSIGGWRRHKTRSKTAGI